MCICFTTGIVFEAGDVLMIQPQNMSDTVQEFLKLLHLDPTTSFYLETSDPDAVLPSTLPNPCSIEYLVTHYLDINGSPRR